jgi:hypothetical protein
MARGLLRRGGATIVIRPGRTTRITMERHANTRRGRTLLIAATRISYSVPEPSTLAMSCFTSIGAGVTRRCSFRSPFNSSTQSNQ